MACATKTFGFVGKVVSCESRFLTTVTRAFVTEHVANWVVTIEIETAEPDAPAPAGETAAFLVHSPTRLFLASADEVGGWRCKFTIERTVEGDRIGWSALTASRIE